MRILHKHLLSFDKTFTFCSETLKHVNAFSEEALKIISSEVGQFYTLLPLDANLDNLYAFSHSILPLESENRSSVGSLPGIYTYTPIISLEKEFAAFLYDHMLRHAYQFMSDHFNATYKVGYINEWFDLYGTNYQEEIYYFLFSQVASLDSIERCLCYSKTFWHSLCILSRAGIVGQNQKTLQLSDIQKFCSAAEFILIGAYDGDGYVVWQKKQS